MILETCVTNPWLWRNVVSVYCVLGQRNEGFSRRESITSKIHQYHMCCASLNEIYILFNLFLIQLFFSLVFVFVNWPISLVASVLILDDFSTESSIAIREVYL